ncbi:MAG: arginine--tRNA ligase [Elusimicrobia bacterium CG08_land_8_20_14_0_20_51_18]|nr:MAG: arginine--tRNA ligase [Elusimicrobia bacterium CG08_land_8_20_14_0_20_51_18]
MEIKKLEKKIKAILSKHFPPENLESFFLSQPPAHISADASTNFALSIAKKERKNPVELAKKLCEILAAEKIGAEVMGAGFVNIRLEDSFFFEFAEKFSGAGYFKNPENARKNILLEFVSANPTGPLHLASGSAATMGDSLARIMNECGCSARREYYVNDVGNQVKMLGLSLKARFLKKELPENGYQGEYLVGIAGKLPPEAENWPDEKFSAFAIGEILKLHKKDMEDFRVTFDRWFEESEIHKKNLPAQTFEKLKAGGMAYQKDGAWWFGSSAQTAENGENGDDKDRVLVKSDGNNTYFLNDLSYHMHKYERGFNRVIDILGADHHGYVPRMKAGIKAMGGDPDSFTVIIHQMVYIKRGEEILKMSKRAGDFIPLRELLDEVGTDACRFFFSMRSPNTHLIFDIDLAKKKSNDNPVFYVQYVHARINSIFENAKEKGFDADEKADFSAYKLNPEERGLLLKALWLERVLDHCLKDLSPHHLNGYLMELAGLFHSFYDKHKVVNPENEEQTLARLLMMKTVKHAIKTGLGLLGVSAPDKM